MKFRSDFVTNSSSSSFIVIKNDATDEELRIIKNYCNSKENKDSWRLTDKPECLLGFTYMDNDYIWQYMREHGVREEIFDIGDDWW